MEILIIGGFLVALMVLVSTKIKRNAAKAFEPESIEKEDFSIEKPEGFLYPLHDKPEFPFEAYSRFYGERSTRNIWRARARLRISKGLNLQKLLNGIKANGESVESKEYSQTAAGGLKQCVVKSRKTVDEVNYATYRKLVETRDRNQTYELRITMLETYADEYADRADQMMQSFEVR